MALKIANNAISKLAGAIGTADVSITVTAGDGAKFPTLANGDWFPLTLVKADGTYEIVKCTARNGDAFTVTRSQEATVAQSFAAGDKVELRLTAAAIQSMIDATVNAQSTADGKLDASGKAVDADKLDGNDSTYFAPIQDPDFTGTPKKGGVNLATVNDKAPDSAKWNGANKTVSTADPTGGVDGDVWFKYQ